jgi:hypothetical protein
MRLRIISLGAGVQSTTMALMAAHGEIDMPDAAIFADTQWEPKAVYQHLEWLKAPGRLPFPIHVVTRGNIRDGIFGRRNTSGGRFAAIPWHIVNQDGTSAIGRRQCSNEYKLEPIMWRIRHLLGVSRHTPIAPGSVEVMIGISKDEAHRMRPARQRYMTNRYPLIELQMRRFDCLQWLKTHGYPEPQKSACIGCPFHNNVYWRDLKNNRPDEWAEAVEMDRVLRTGDARGMRGIEYMHHTKVPLDQADLELELDAQLDLFGNECEGVCGV